MQEFKNLQTGDMLTRIYEENEETLRKMLEDTEKMKSDGYDLTGRFRNIKRKSPCPCGSGKKFKNCCGE